MTTNDDRGGWQPVPQGGEYDAEATAFVQLPEGMDLSSAPLAAPGHGYVPPMILPLTPAAGTDPAAMGQWTVPQPPEQAQQADPSHQPYQTHQSGQPYASGPPYPVDQSHQPYETQHVPETPYWPEPVQDPHAGPGYPQEPMVTGQWTFGDAQDSPVPEQPHQQQHEQHQHQPHQQHGGDLTGQWTIPVAEGDVPEESGEYAASSLTRPATLPGGARAPWAVPVEPEPDHGTPADGTPVPQGEHGTGVEPPAPAGSGHGTAAGEPDVPGGGYETDHGRDQGGSAGHGGEGDVRDPRETQAPTQAQAPHPAPDRQDVPAPREAEFDAAPGAGPEAAPPVAGPDGAHPDAVDPAAVHSDTAHSDTVASEPSTEDPGTEDPGTEAAGAEGAAAPPAAAVAPAVWGEHTPASYVLRVNGTDRPVTDAWIGESLLYVLRERLGLAGAKDGCSQGECGACNVQVDGRLVASCLVPAATAAGSEVRTVEGLAVNGEPSDVQRALAECGAVQCGFCIPGMAMTVHDLLEGNHAPTELETRQALSGNLCRCSGYRGVLDAVGEVVAGRAEAGAASDEARIPHQAAPGSGSMQPDNPQQHDGGMA
ncbi:2Fe-2S iron-sulfur cluster-binding protein [Streptomyces sp. NBC_01180]|uniref:2Fe-2S iron-sulfur cluster-binding protein n=1 Tax=Streptomyces sp. NBC_01180 TaxID=2903763 RepID=UPI0038659E3C|nr:2Fe-2S iron-sulfur cluster-binding protein [Streptomyces sp. NBC_01180]